MKTPEKKAKEAERARFRYHNNPELRARKMERMKIWASLNKQRVQLMTPAQIERRREYQRKRNKTPERMEQKRQAQTRYRNKMKALGLYKNDSSRGNRTLSTRRWLAKPGNRFKKKAHLKVYEAVKKGLLKPELCEKCGKKGLAHHDDYSKPLDVRWLCPLHHSQHHRGMVK